MPIVPGACMLTSGLLMDQALFDGVGSLSCRSDCDPTPRYCLDAWNDLDVGVTATEAGRVAAPDSSHGLTVAALIMSIMLSLASFALLVWLILRINPRYEILTYGVKMAQTCWWLTPHRQT